MCARTRVIDLGEIFGLLEGARGCSSAPRAGDSASQALTRLPQEGYDALRDVIYHLETFDVTTIRAGHAPQPAKALQYTAAAAAACGAGARTRRQPAGQGMHARTRAPGEFAFVCLWLSQWV